MSIRRGFQFALLAIILYAVFSGGDVEKYCPAGGMSSLAGQIMNGRMSCQMSAINIFMFFAVVGSVIIAGRLFCSFLCPLGTAGEGLAIAGKNLGLAKNIRSWPDKVLRAAKYILLFFVLKETFLSSELFCKTFDPYFAIAGGFKHEVVPWAGITAILTLVVGAVAGKLFWCKYVCFFGAAQNILSTLFGALAGAIYLGSVKFAGGGADMVVFFGIICGAGYLSEILSAQKYLPIVKIARNADTCTSCGLCDKACPYGIEVSTCQKVTDSDCFLCGECVNRCPVGDTLTYTPFGGKWLAPLLTVILIYGAFIGTGSFGTDSSFATVRFVPDGLVVDGKTVAVYQRDNVSNIHCFGSSMSFIQRLGRGKKKDGSMNWKKGVLGAETYAATGTFKVFYDPARTTPAKIDGMIFRSGKLGVHGVCSANPVKGGRISVWKIGIWELLDDWSIAALRKKLEVSPHIYAVETHFGEPVTADIYYDGDAISPDGIKKVFEDAAPVVFSPEKELTYHFKANGEGTFPEKVAVDAFKRKFFPYISRTIDKELLSATEESMAGGEPSAFADFFEVPLKGLDDPFISWSMMKISGHLKILDGALQLRTGLNGALQPVLKIMAVKGTLSIKDIEEVVAAKVLRYPKGDGFKEQENPYTVIGEVTKIDYEQYMNKE